MKKVSNASFVIGIVLIVLAVVLNVLGFLDINGIRYVQYYGNRLYSMTYTTSSSNQMICLALIIAGGFMFVGGIMLLMLSALTCPCRCKHHEHKCEEAPQKAEEPAPCCCKAEEKAAVEEPVEEQVEKPAEEPAEEEAAEPAAEPVEEQAD